ncbi:10294_t:CDS:2 [Funneliformis caledonium]|uniref:10294_t:CDS:1 n=1 Tax=Funneliformis caledonium TaxID=1117310 RepID=A0A9N9FGR5_9GLOM|nr:10294_t:CDS:2 [Funneliformis caledonium]
MCEITSIVLFGLTGEGKSTISNMLIQGDIHDEAIRSTAVGVSLNVQCSVNDRFIVYDTIGIGEPSDGTVPHIKAARHGGSKKNSDTLKNFGDYPIIPLSNLKYEGIVLEVLNADQKTANKVAQVIEIIPQKNDLKVEPLGLLWMFTCVNTLREGAIVGKAAYKGIKAAAVYTLNKSENNGTGS